jgi:hypothetical protein
VFAQNDINFTLLISNYNKEKLLLTHQSSKRIALLALLAVAMFLSVVAILLPGMQVAAAKSAQTTAAELAQDGTPKENKGKVLEFDVAEDMSRFVFAPTPVFEEDGYPAYGNPFITQGYIYPKGTIACDDDGCTGVNLDGSPEFPDLVLGEWTCRGWFIGDGAHTTSGPVVITTQVYNFGTEFGRDMLVSEGYELADEGVVFQRAITGGTGQYKGSRGEISQIFLGWNASEGVSLSFSLKAQN